MKPSGEILNFGNLRTCRRPAFILFGLILGFLDLMNHSVSAQTVDSFTFGFGSNDPHGANSIVTGSDGALWFLSDGLVARLRTGPGPSPIIVDGARLTTFKVPFLGDNAYGAAIAAGSDGALWFLNSNFAKGGFIDRITTAGELTEYPNPMGIRSFSITAGPDGAIWFTTQTDRPVAGISSIGRIDSNGIVTQFDTPSDIICNHGPCGAKVVTAGPDGALWFTTQGDAIGRMTVSGSVTYFQLHDGAAASQSIVDGPDGALGFTGSHPFFGSS